MINDDSLPVTAATPPSTTVTEKTATTTTIETTATILQLLRLFHRRHRRHMSFMLLLHWQRQHCSIADRLHLSSSRCVNAPITTAALTGFPANLQSKPMPTPKTVTQLFWIAVSESPFASPRLPASKNLSTLVLGVTAP